MDENTQQYVCATPLYFTSLPFQFGQFKIVLLLLKFSLAFLLVVQLSPSAILGSLTSSLRRRLLECIIHAIQNAGQMLGKCWARIMCCVASIHHLPILHFFVVVGVGWWTMLFVSIIIAAADTATAIAALQNQNLQVVYHIKLYRKKEKKIIK